MTTQHRPPPQQDVPTWIAWFVACILFCLRCHSKVIHFIWQLDRLQCQAIAFHTTQVFLGWLVAHSQDSTVWEILMDGVEGFSICGTFQGAGSPKGQEAHLYRKSPGCLSGKKSALRRPQESGAIVSSCVLQACLSLERKHGPLVLLHKVHVG